MLRLHTDIIPEEGLEWQCYAAMMAGWSPSLEVQFFETALITFALTVDTRAVELSHVTWTGVRPKSQIG